MLVANQRTWIGVLGSAFLSLCLDQSSSRPASIGDKESGSALVADRRAWIEVLLTMLGSETKSGSALVANQRAWIGVLLAVLGSEIESGSALVADRRAWIGVLLVVLGS
nr:hypothetical protein CFP56_74035 [Quercus suber]